MTVLLVLAGVVAGVLLSLYGALGYLLSRMAGK